ncbi:hypothetical protein GOBAR_AA22479 [Gossypium barbadense]|uniref:Uncharacterized protein n=1 Tax=Gossypium barbadense TaxID=3634 RepID=A0A2P5X4C8_GOSBA|nr:hypothetical protein GOBAR_AA22479 [Gossypium barbadense]
MKSLVIESFSRAKDPIQVSMKSSTSWLISIGSTPSAPMIGVILGRSLPGSKEPLQTSNGPFTSARAKRPKKAIHGTPQEDWVEHEKLKSKIPIQQDKGKCNILEVAIQILTFDHLVFKIQSL